MIARTMDEKDKKLRDLALSFPSLAAIPWVVDCDPTKLHLALAEVQAGRDGHGAGCRWAAGFCVHVWTGGPLDLWRCIRAWDDDHLRAWQAWAAAPYYL
jgi:hypothetical protein